jgi:hypothetical protein
LTAVLLAENHYNCMCRFRFKTFLTIVMYPNALIYYFVVSQQISETVKMVCALSVSVYYNNYDNNDNDYDDSKN